MQGTHELVTALGDAPLYQLPAERERLYVQHSHARLDSYWGKAQTDFRKAVQRILDRGLERAWGVDDMIQRLRHATNISRNRAALIVRNEVGNASAYGQQATQEEAGITHYEWVAASDERVRPEHAARNGKIFAWDNPPADGHPGQPIQCRCVSVPVWDEEASERNGGVDTDPSALPSSHEPSYEVTTPTADLPLPKKRTYIDGPTDERIERILDKLQSDYPSPKQPAHKLCYQEEDWQETKRLIRMRPEEGAAAVYVRSADIIAISHTVTRLLDSRDPRERLAGTRYLIHKWFHAMRTDDRRVYPLEEGGAELFADRITRQLTGIDGKLRRIQPYAGFTKGVVLLGEESLGRERALHWVKQSRVVDNIREWLKTELSALGLEDTDIRPILDYDENSKDSWPKLIEQAMKRTKQ